MSVGDDDETRAFATASSGASATILAPPLADSERAHAALLPTVDPSRYEVIRELARGGMGRIWIARDLRLGREVAIKEVLQANAPALARFQREVQITARLQHPSIVSVLEAGSWPSGDPFYAMPYLVGRPLDDVIASATTSAERIGLLPHVVAVADAMAYAHRRRVIHRDLKPRNILVGEFGETVVLDWGLAKHLGDVMPIDRASHPAIDGSSPLGSVDDAATAFGDVIGTPAYMPPEQAAGQVVDERADVYAIGAVLYHVLVGSPPYEGASAVEVLAEVASGEPPRIRERAIEVADELVAIVERAMARNPASRYPSARELAEDLRRFQAGQLVGAHRYSTKALLGRWLRRHRTAVIAFVATVVIAAAVGAVALHRVLRAEDNAEVQRRAAVARKQDADDLLQFMIGDLSEKLRDVGKLELLEAVASRLVAYYDSHAALGDDDRLSSARAHLGLGLVLQARGDPHAALAQVERSRETLAGLAAAHPDDARYAETERIATFRLASVRVELGDSQSALALFRAVAKECAGSTGRKNKVLEVDSWLHVARIEYESSDTDAALADIRSAIALVDRLASDAELKDDLAYLRFEAYEQLGRVLANRRATVDAIAALRTSISAGDAWLAQRPGAPMRLTDLSLVHRDLGAALRASHDATAGVAELVVSVDYASRAVAVEPEDVSLVDKLGNAHSELAQAYLDADKVELAAEQSDAASSLFDRLLARQGESSRILRDGAAADITAGDVAFERRDNARALAKYRAAVAKREKLVAIDPHNAEWRRGLMYAHFEEGAAHRENKDLVDAEREFRIALDLAVAALSDHAKNFATAFDAVDMYATLGDALVTAGRRGEANETYAAALALLDEASHWRDPPAEVIVKRSNIAAKLSRVGR